MRKMLLGLLFLSMAVGGEFKPLNEGSSFGCINDELFMKITTESGKIMYLPVWREDDTVESCYIDDEYLEDLEFYGIEL